MTMTIQSVPVSDITIDTDTDFRSTGTDVSELAASIKAYGLMQPITIAPGPDGGFQVVAGRRRLRAVIELGADQIDAIIRDDLDTDQSRVIGQIIENLQREDVGILDEARAFAQLGEYGMKQKDVALACGVSPAHVSGRLALLKLHPDLIKRLEEGKLPHSLAVKIARLPKAVRDSLGTGPISEFDVTRAERQHEEAKAIEALMKDLAEATGLPVAGRMPGGTYASVDQMAEEIGLTEEDKPKSHEWDVVGRVHRSDHPDDESFVAALSESGAKGLYVQSAGAHATIVLIGSANLDKARKEAQEEQRRVAEEREAAAAKRRADFDDALAPLIDSPDKAKVLAILLEDAIDHEITGWGVAPRLVTAADRLGIAYDEETDLEAVLKEHANRSVTDAVRVLLATQDSLSDLLIGLGFLDNYPTEHIPTHLQVALVKNGDLDRSRLTPDAEERLAQEEAADAEDDEIDAEVERRVALHVEGAEDEVSEEELEAVRDQIRSEVEAEITGGEEE